MRFSFFSYGAFAEGQIHHAKYANLIQSQKTAFIKADVYRLRCGYPILDLNEVGDLVEGILYELEAPESFFPILDEFLGVDISKHEKCFFNRVQADVLVDNFSRTPAQVYCINPKKLTKIYSKIENGMWQKDLTSHSTVIEQLQPRHREYICKLSKSKGRDIVPIKLDLYRELMSMEMIVDKGRRLALTPLGKEVSFFIQ